jgi:hypothetical protein
VIYVDDGGVFSTKENIDTLTKAISKDFKVKYLGKLEHFVGCHIIENQKKDTLWIHQPKLLKHLKETYSNLVTTPKNYKTPAGPKTLILCPKPGDPLISADDQFKLRSVVAMLLYLVKYSHPDISNAVLLYYSGNTFTLIDEPPAFLKFTMQSTTLQRSI